MKLIITILRDQDHEQVSNALTSEGFRMTLIASTGGFLRRGSMTFLIGAEDEQVEKALGIIRQNVHPSIEPGEKSTSIYVIQVDEYLHF